MILLSTATPGRCLAFDPVAITTFFASTVSESICIFQLVPPETSLPCPCSQVILFFLNRPATPLVILPTILSFLSSMVFRSSFTPLAVMPCALNWCSTRS